MQPLISQQNSAQWQQLALEILRETGPLPIIEFEHEFRYRNGAYADHSLAWGQVVQLIGNRLTVSSDGHYVVSIT